MMSRKSRVPFTPEPPVAGKKRGRRKVAEEEVPAEPDKWLKYVQQVQAQLAKIRFTMTLQAAYEGDGWRQSNAEKHRPDGELIAARKTALKAKQRIRELLREIDAESAAHTRWNAWGPEKGPSASRVASAGLTRRDGDSGSIKAEDICCSRCGGADAEDDNDILLCDYAPCGLAYHQRCGDPPLAALPPEDADWLCPRCTCLVTCVATVAEELGLLQAGAEEEEGEGRAGAPPPLPAYSEHWDDVFDGVEAEARAVDAEEAAHAERRRRLLTGAAGRGGRRQGAGPSDEEGGERGAEEGADEDEVAALLRDGGGGAAPAGSPPEDDDGGGGGGGKRRRPSARAAAVSARARITAELAAAAAVPAPTAAAFDAAEELRQGGGGVAADEEEEEDDDGAFSPSSDALFEAGGSEGGASEAGDGDGGAGSEGSRGSSASPSASSGDGSGDEGDEEEDVGSEASAGLEVGGFSLRSRRRPVDYVALARAMYGEAAAAPGRDVDAEEGDDDWHEAPAGGGAARQ